MNSQDELRIWIREQLEPHGRGARVRLAEFLGVMPVQITNLLNLNAERETRNIQADEWLKILLFLGYEETNPKLPRAALKQGKPVITLPDSAPAPSLQRVLLNKIFDNAEPEQKKLILSLIRAVAAAQNIPHKL